MSYNEHKLLEIGFLVLAVGVFIALVAWSVVHASTIGGTCEVAVQGGLQGSLSGDFSNPKAFNFSLSENGNTPRFLPAFDASGSARGSAEGLVYFRVPCYIVAEVLNAKDEYGRRIIDR